MKFLSSRRSRAGMLLVGCMLVGGTGCITASLIDDARYNRQVRERERARQGRIAALKPAADAGDSAALTAMALELLAAPQPPGPDQPQALRLLSQAAGKGDGRAQALLGDMLLSGRLKSPGYAYPVAPELRDRERGLRLLRQAATQACGFNPVSTTGWIDTIKPATVVGDELERAGRIGEAALWHARAVLHCHEPGSRALSLRVLSKYATPQQRIDALDLLLLAPDREDLAKVEAALPAELLVAARRHAEQLRRQVAQSEQEYPAPTRKEM